MAVSSDAVGRTPGRDRIGASLARLRSAAWLGWLVEGNWADPLLFAIYVVARPLATSLILVAMYWAVRGHATHAAAFAGFYVASAFHAYVERVVVGMGWAVFEEREEYETLKYVYASPIGMLTYLLGRSCVKFVLATISVVIVLGVGWFVLGVRWHWETVAWMPLLVTLALGFASAVFFGFLLAGWALVLTRAAMIVIEGATLALFLLSGVIFPLDLLPWPLRAISLALPFTWWYEAIRRFLLGHGSSALLGRLSAAELLGGLALVTVVFAIVSHRGFRAFEHRARRLGRIDQTTLF